MLYKPVDLGTLIARVRELLPDDVDIAEGSFVVEHPDAD